MESGLPAEGIQPTDFIRKIMVEELASGSTGGIIQTRFPPEPNGYLHIGHAKSICLNFGVAAEHQRASPGLGRCHLRYDDTNPLKESQEYVDAIQRDVRWLGFDWGEHLYFTSDYFETIRALTESLIRRGLAYVDDLTPEQMREYRGTLTEPGRESPWRNRAPEENLDLFRRMQAGEFPEGARVLRAKIDMKAPNINLRDPVLYRIRHVVHHRAGAQWRIYPTYDYSHPIADALEGITHSLCTLEFEDHRPLYDWVLDHLELPSRPRQIEFARLSLEFTVMSKRKLNRLVTEKWVDGWDDPRLPTLAGLRRRGYTPASIREFCRRIGMAKSDNRVELAQLENCLREDLDQVAPRAMAVLAPLRVVIENYPEGGSTEWLTAPAHPKDPALGTRQLPFTRELFIDAADYCENPPKDYKRLVPGGEVRLRNAYVIRAREAIRDAQGALIALHCTYDPATLSANPEGRKVRGVIHWVSALHALPAEVRLYDRLFTVPNPDEEEQEGIHPDSLRVVTGARVEPSLAAAVVGQGYQFEREGYFVLDARDATPDHLVFNRAVTLREGFRPG